MKLELLDGALAIHELRPDAAAITPAARGPLVSVMATGNVTTVVCPASIRLASARAVIGWRAIRVAGSIDFDQTGILAELSRVLARADVAIFVLSSYETDYLLVREPELPRARAALEDAGHGFVGPAPAKGVAT